MSAASSGAGSGSLSVAFASLPPGLRADLLDAFNEVVANYSAGRWEPSELNGGKLCEAVYTVVRGLIDGAMPSSATKPRNMVDACRALESESSSVPRSLRIQIPRVLMGLYEVRNNRGVGHVGGDVDPNRMDASLVLATSKWLVAELVRILHGLTTEEAAQLVGALVEREVPLIWEVAGRKRVLDAKTTMKDKTLILLYGEPAPITESQLLEWTEHSNASVYRRDVLRAAHRARLIEFDATTKLVYLSPAGVDYVETRFRDQLM